MIWAQAPPLPATIQPAESHPTSTSHPAVLSVLIPVYEGADYLERCLEAVFRSEYEPFEVIVMDDGSRDDSSAIAERYPVRLIRWETNQGVSAARNEAARSAVGDLLFFLDADVLVEPDTLRRVVEAFEGSPEVAAVFCSYGKETTPSNFFTIYKNLVHHYTHQISRRDAATFCGGFGAIRRDVFLEVDGFDEGHRFLEDIDLGYRLHHAGHRIRLLKDVQLTHMKSYSLAGLVRSDLFGRAVPWTVLMLRHRVFRNDLNTQANNVASVVVSGLLPVVVALPMPLEVRALLGAFLVTALVVLNAGFLGFVRRERGLWFSVRSAATTWMIYVLSGVGLLLGALSFTSQAMWRRMLGRHRCS